MAATPPCGAAGAELWGPATLRRFRPSPVAAMMTAHRAEREEERLGECGLAKLLAEQERRFVEQRAELVEGEFAR